ncbi:MAG: AAC(3) family N-acetyltransferase [Verrucomicrobiota bacterium]
MDIKKIFADLGVLQRPVVIHASFKKMRAWAQAPSQLTQIFQESFPTIMMPAFTHHATVGAPQNDHPKRNGMDYQKKWVSPHVPFLLENAPIDPRMGILAKELSIVHGCHRSDHAWHSWLAWGKNAEMLVADHSWDTTNLPLERLAEQGGWVVLMGVGLEACTAIHIAEERAGRKPFIRWALDRNEVCRRVRASGCAKGFNHLRPQLKMLRSAKIRECEFLAAPLNELIATAAEVLKNNPSLSACSKDCLKCKDMIAGGPV